MFNNSLLIHSTMIYLGLLGLFYILKPDIVYDKENDKFKSFGLGKNEDTTIFPLWLIAIIPGILYFGLSNILEITKTI
jgi:hypothetical protein